MKLNTNWRTWEINPVVVKELRQSVRSRSVTGMLMVFLVVLFIASLGFLAGQSLTITPNQAIGRELFQFYFWILTGACVFFIPALIATRLTSERQENNVDLLYITTLSPGCIIRGKFFCGVYLTVFFFSACMPFMLLSNQLRGVDLPTIFVVLTMVFLLCCFIIQFAIFLACMPVSRNAKIIITLPTFIFSTSLFGGLGFASAEMMQSGVGSLLGTSRFWLPALTTLTVGGLLFGMFYLLSVALISPQSANRALPLRRYITLVWLLCGVISWLWSVVKSDSTLVVPWAITSQVIFTIALLVGVSEQETRSIRVLQAVPTTWRKRFVAFFFYNGPAGGILWAFILMQLTIFIMTVANWEKWAVLNIDQYFIGAESIALYTFCYGLAARQLYRRFGSHRPPIAAGMLALLLPGLWAIVPNLIMFFLNNISWSALERLQLGNVFNVFMMKSDEDRYVHLFFAGAGALLIAAMNHTWLREQWDSFVPYQSSRATVPK